MVRKLILATLMFYAWPLVTMAQPGPGPTPSPWQYNGLNIYYPNGCVVVGSPSTCSGNLLVLPPLGLAPSSPPNGAMWSTSSGLFVEVGGSAIGPLAPATSAGFAKSNPLALSFPSGVVTYGLNFDANFALNGSNALALANCNANTVIAGPSSGSAAEPGCRSLVGLDIPPIALGTVGSNGGVSGTLGTGNGGTGLASLGAGVTTALGNAVNASNGILTYGLLGTSGGTLCLLNTACTYSGNFAISGASFGLSGNISGSGIFGTSGNRYANVAGTITDTSASGTVASVYGSLFGGNTYAASNAVTITNGYDAYFKNPVAGTDVTFTKGWAFGADSAQINGNLNVTSQYQFQGQPLGYNNGLAGFGTAAAQSIGTSGGNIGLLNGANTYTNGTWNGNVIGAAYGGTGANNGSATGVGQWLSGTYSVSSALANGSTATTQTTGDNTTKLATDAFVIANATGSTGVNSVGNYGADSTLSITGSSGSGPWEGNVTAKINPSASIEWTGTETHNGPFGILGTETGGTSGPWWKYTRCVRPEQDGAQHDASTIDTGSWVAAINAAAAADLGFCFGPGAYDLTSIQLGGAYVSSVTAVGGTGGVSSSTLTTTSHFSEIVGIGYVLSGSGISGSPTLTACPSTGCGMVGTYSMSSAQTISAGTTITATAPTVTATLSGTTLDVTAITGALAYGDDLTNSGLTVGVVVTGCPGGNCATTGDYTVSCLPSGCGTPSGAITAYPRAIASLPLFFRGSGTDAVIRGATLTTASAQPLIAFNNFNATPGDNTANFDASYFLVNARNQFQIGAEFTGYMLSTAHNYSATGANGEGVLIQGYASNNTEYSLFYNIGSFGNSSQAYVLNGNNGDGDYYVQSDTLSDILGANSGTDGMDADYANFTCSGVCDLESSAGLPLSINHSTWVKFPAIYTEGSGGEITGTSNSGGVEIKGKSTDGVNSALMSSCTATIDYFNGTSEITNSGCKTAQTLTLAAASAAVSSGQLGMGATLVGVGGSCPAVSSNTGCIVWYNGSTAIYIPHW